MRIKRYLGERVCAIAENLNLPRTTVESVVREYLKSLEISAMNGENVVIDNIVTIKLIENEQGIVIPRGRVSPSLKAKLEYASQPNNEKEGE